jgi:hypothetical protein
MNWTPSKKSKTWVQRCLTWVELSARLCNQLNLSTHWNRGTSWWWWYRILLVHVPLSSLSPMVQTCPWTYKSASMGGFTEVEASKIREGSVPRRDRCDASIPTDNTPHHPYKSNNYRFGGFFLWARALLNSNEPVSRQLRQLSGTKPPGVQHPQTSLCAQARKAESGLRDRSIFFSIFLFKW